MSEDLPPITEQREKFFLEAEQARVDHDLQKAREGYLSELHRSSVLDLGFKARIGLGMVHYTSNPPKIRRGLFHLRRTLRHKQAAHDQSWTHFYLGEFYDLRADKILIQKGRSASWRKWSLRTQPEQERVLQLDPTFLYRAHVLRNVARKVHFLKGIPRPDVSHITAQSGPDISLLRWAAALIASAKVFTSLRSVMTFSAASVVPPGEVTFRLKACGSSGLSISNFVAP